jgi:hypothetical protein
VCLKTQRGPAHNDGGIDAEGPLKIEAGRGALVVMKRRMEGLVRSRKSGRIKGGGDQAPRHQQ